MIEIQIKVANFSDGVFGAVSGLRAKRIGTEMDARALPIFMSQPTEIMRLNHPLERSDSLQRLARSLMPDQAAESSHPGANERVRKDLAMLIAFSSLGRCMGHLQDGIDRRTISWTEKSLAPAFAAGRKELVIGFGGLPLATKQNVGFRFHGSLL